MMRWMMYKRKRTVISNDDLLDNSTKISLIRDDKKVNRLFCKKTRVIPWPDQCLFITFFSHSKNWTSCVHNNVSKLNKDTSRNTKFQCRVNDIFNFLSAGRYFILNQTMKVNCQLPPIYNLLHAYIVLFTHLTIITTMNLTWNQSPSNVNVVPSSINNSADWIRMMLMTINQV